MHKPQKDGAPLQCGTVVVIVAAVSHLHLLADSRKSMGQIAEDLTVSGHAGS